MDNKKITAVTVGTDDIYFIIGNKETSILKLMSDLDEKIGQFALGAWMSLALTVILGIPGAYAFLSYSEIKEQNQAIEKQNDKLEKQNDKFETQIRELTKIVYEYQIKNQ